MHVSRQHATAASVTVSRLGRPSAATARHPPRWRGAHAPLPRARSSTDGCLLDGGAPLEVDPPAPVMGAEQTARALYLRAPLTPLSRVDHDGPVVVAGPLPAGAEVAAAGDVVVCGMLEGAAHAACAGSMVVAALGFARGAAVSVGGVAAKQVRRVWLGDTWVCGLCLVSTSRTQRSAPVTSTVRASLNPRRCRLLLIRRWRCLTEGAWPSSPSPAQPWQRRQRAKPRGSRRSCCRPRRWRLARR